jgi:putative ABC transport system substrate-binding protein
VLAILATGAVSAAFVASAQQKTHRIGLLWIGREGMVSYLAILRESLRTLGYIEGRNLVLDERFLVDGYERLPEAAAKLADSKPELIITYGGTAVLAARKATATIPILMASGGDPVKMGLATSLSRPGGNVTGVTFISPELSGKRLELLRELVPDLRRVAVILYSQSQSERQSLKNFESAAKILGVEMQPVDVSSADKIAPAIASVAMMKVGAIMVISSSLFTTNRKLFADEVAKIKLPAIYGNTDFVDVGGLIAYAPKFSDGLRRLAIYADKILKGARPGELPIEQPTGFELAVNVKAANAQGIAIPRSLLLRADRVIE